MLLPQRLTEIDLQWRGEAECLAESWGGPGSEDRMDLGAASGRRNEVALKASSVDIQRGFHMFSMCFHDF